MANLFEKLPFREAIEAFFDRLAVPRAEFLEWDAAARSRAYTMAFVRDQAVLETVHDELGQAIAEGKSYADFAKALRENHLRGWTGTEPWHQRLVYEQNLSMAYSAGRVQQATELGVRAWRYLPSISDEPRPDHEPYYGNLYRFAPGAPVPPIDFNCACGWEVVFPHELEALGIDPNTLPVFDPPVPRSGFVWSPSDYASLAGPSMTAASRLAGVLAGERVAVCSLRASTGRPEDVAGWVEAATQAGAELAERKMERILAWAHELDRDGWPLAAIAARINEALPVAANKDDAKLDYLATFAAWLKGRVAVTEQSRK